MESTARVRLESGRRRNPRRTHCCSVETDTQKNRTASSCAARSQSRSFQGHRLARLHRVRLACRARAARLAFCQRVWGKTSASSRPSVVPPPAENSGLSPLLGHTCFYYTTSTSSFNLTAQSSKSRVSCRATRCNKLPSSQPCSQSSTRSVPSVA